MPRAFALVALLTLLPACYMGPVFKLAPQAKRSCATSDFLEYDGGLPFFVSQGNGDGTFDFDPTGSLMVSTQGLYDITEGQFLWTTQYAADAHRVEETAQGTGVIARNGDVDLEYALTISFSDDSEEVWDIRTKRAACAETTRVENVDLGLLSLIDTIWGTDGRDWERYFIQDTATPTGVGHQDKDGSWTETVDFKKNEVQVAWTQTDDAQGYQRRDFDDDNGNTVTTGYWERWYGGTVVMDFTAKNRNFKKQFWTLEINNLGDGAGTWEQEGVTCELKFTGHNCKQRACSDGSENRSCSMPIEWPRF
ncbi:MAG: hypothetical protein GWP91_21345 [Rhodobacterales bacterium]|nr:hypothetical protein [Rhodobacterales bacterium]